MSVSVTVNGGQRVLENNRPVLILDLTVGTSHQQIRFDETDLKARGSTAAQLSYIAAQALSAVSGGTTVTTTPAGVTGIIGTTTAATGSMPVAGFGVTQRTVTANAAVLTTDCVIFADATNGNINLTMPTAVGVGGTQYFVKKLDSSANTVTITPAGSEKVDGASTWVIKAKNEAVLIISDGANWQTNATQPSVGLTNGTAAALGAITDANAKTFITAVSDALVKAGILASPA